MSLAPSLEIATMTMMMLMISDGKLVSSTIVFLFDLQSHKKIVKTSQPRTIFLIKNKIMKKHVSYRKNYS